MEFLTGSQYGFIVKKSYWGDYPGIYYKKYDVNDLGGAQHFAERLNKATEERYGLNKYNEKRKMEVPKMSTEARLKEGEQAAFSVVARAQIEINKANTFRLKPEA